MELPERVTYPQHRLVLQYESSARKVDTQKEMHKTEVFVADANSRPQVYKYNSMIAFGIHDALHSSAIYLPNIYN